jgi:hypothetical protein
MAGFAEFFVIARSESDEAIHFPRGDGWIASLTLAMTGRGPQPQAAAAFFSSRSSRRRILPTLVFGSSVLNSICFGTL